MACVRANCVSATNWSTASRIFDPRAHPFSDGAASASAVQMITITRINSRSVNAAGWRGRRFMAEDRVAVDTLLLGPVRHVVVTLAAVRPHGEEVRAVRVVLPGEPVDVLVAPRVLRNAPLDVRPVPVLHRPA